MKNNRLTQFLMFVALSLATVTSASAAVYRWSFSDVNQSNFAFLDFDTVTYDFRLFDNTANAYLSSPIGINGISFDFVGPVILTTPVVTGPGAWASVSIGNLSVTTDPPLLSGYSDAFATTNNNEGNEINNGESTMFNFGPIAYANIDNIAVRLNSSNGALNSSGTWVGGTLVQITPVPEPEISAMMAIGLGLIGFIAKRRRKL